MIPTCLRNCFGEPDADSNSNSSNMWLFENGGVACRCGLKDVGEMLVQKKQKPFGGYPKGFLCCVKSFERKSITCCSPDSGHSRFGIP
jgi:hypothetical protein